MSVTGPDPKLWSTQEEGWLSDLYFLRVFSNGLLIIELSLMTISSLPERVGGREKIMHQFHCLGQHLCSISSVAPPSGSRMLLPAMPPPPWPLWPWGGGSFPAASLWMPHHPLVGVSMVSSSV